MRTGFRFFFVVFYVVAILIFTVYLHSVNDRIFYRLCAQDIKQRQLKQHLWQKQLELESLINPAAISERLNKNPQ